MKHINKKCNSCYQDKPVIAFYKNQAAKDELDGTCKECRNIRNKRTNTYNNPKHNPQRMYVNGKYVPKSHPLYKAGRFKTFEGAAFASLEGYANTTEGYVYIINNPCWDGWVKVGMAIDAEDRCKQYQTSSPFRDYKLCYLKHFEDRKIAEQSAHKELKKITDTYNGEWFQTSVKEAKKTIEAL